MRCPHSMNAVHRMCAWFTSSYHHIIYLHTVSFFLHHTEHRERFHRLYNKKSAMYDVDIKIQKRVPECFFFAIHCELLSSFRNRVRVEHSLLFSVFCCVLGISTKMEKSKSINAMAFKGFGTTLILCWFLTDNCLEHMSNVCKSFACLVSRKLCAGCNPHQSLSKGLKTHRIYASPSP